MWLSLVGFFDDAYDCERLQYLIILNFASRYLYGHSIQLEQLFLWAWTTTIWVHHVE